MSDVLLSIWRFYSALAGVFLAAATLTYVTIDLATPDDDKPVVITRDFKLLTPRVAVGSSFTFQVWRDSSESCSGAGVVSYVKKDNPTTVISQRFPLGTPGYKSPPPLTITRPLPSVVTPGIWRVRTGVDSFCPTRQKYDETGDFELEVY
jgi:hypothetical protein